MEDGKIYTDHYTARGEGARVVLGHAYPGNIRVMELADRALICQKRLFLGSVGDISYGVHFKDKELHKYLPARPDPR